MKTVTAKKNKATSARVRSKNTKRPKATVQANTFRFAPDAIGMMKGPADLSVREGFFKPNGHY
jgi:hypothetical protein